MLRKRTIMFLEGLTVLGFDNISNNSPAESSFNEESNDCSDDFSANKLSTSKKKKRGGTKCSVSCPYGSRRGV